MIEWHLHKIMQKKLNPLIKDSKVLISNIFKREGRNINLKFKQKGKYIITGTIDGTGNGIRYPIRIDVDYKDLIKVYTYLIQYKLVEEVEISVYNKIIEKKLFDSEIENNNNSDINSNSDSKHSIT